MSSPSQRATPRSRRCLVIGGGCYGSHFVEALLRARRKKEISQTEIWILDRDPECQARVFASESSVRLVTRDWLPFFCDYLAQWETPDDALPGDLIVPSPLMPHLFAL